MARVLGYGGIANTNGARSFAGKIAASIVRSIVSSAVYVARTRRRFI